MATPSGTFQTRNLVIAALAAGLGIAGLQLLRPKDVPQASQPLQRQVTALGRLTPEGGLVPLAIPSGGSGSEVIEEWFVSEGDPISKGQLLARLSSYPQLSSSVTRAESALRSTRALLPFLEISQQRGKELFQGGAISEEELAKTTASILEKRADIQASEAELSQARSELNNAEIRSPMNGRVIRIYSFPGMKATDEGVAVIGRTNRMQVWAQVFQTDVNKLKAGQGATITAEAGGFEGELRAKLNAVIGQVSDRDLFAISSNNDVNARVVLVKLDLAPQTKVNVERLSGLNVNVRFDS